MNLPIINHDDYVAKINDDNKFPIKKFGEHAKYLKSEGVTKKFIQPEFCSVEFELNIQLSILIILGFTLSCISPNAIAPP